MTDNEIKKALECCSNSCDDGFAKCDECPRFEEGSGCTLRTMKDAFDLIKRQKAEIERLEKELMKCKLEKEMLYQTINQIKSEAIKELAERFEYFVLHEDPEINELKCKDYESYMGGVNQLRLQIVKGINNRVKEMTEVEK